MGDCGVGNVRPSEILAHHGYSDARLRKRGVSICPVLDLLCDFEMELGWKIC